jgi:hypothetical protein
MTLTLCPPDIDPVAVAWQYRTHADLWCELQQHRQPGRRLVIAVDGRSGSGKTTLADELATQDGRTAVIHTDDIAWHHSFFGWGYLLIDKLLEPLHDGQHSISYTPEAWTRRGRGGAIEIPADTSTLIVEGVGAAARPIRRLLDVVVWVHVSDDLGRRRVLARDVDTPKFVDDWMSEEHAFIGEHRPWEIADVWVNGDVEGTYPHHERGSILAAARPGS